MEKSISTGDYAAFLAMLKQARLKSGVTQAELAERLGLTQPWVSKVERAERRVDLVEARLICQALGVPFTEFVAEFDRRVSTTPKGPKATR